MDQLKVCYKCKESKLRSEFNKNKSKKDGLQGECKICDRENAKNNYKANSERGKKIAKFNQAKYRETNNARPESYYTDRQGRFKYCPKCDQDKPLTRFILNKSAFDGFRNNCLDCHYEYVKHRYKTDPQYKAKRILRAELRKLFKLSGLKKDKKSIELLGVSWTEAYNWLLKTLPEGYTEQDWLDGKLHVDHKIPISWYERLYGTITEDLIKRINHISNLQLLPANDNLSKNNRYGHGINNEIILYEDWVITEQLSTVSH